jgi:hypothetical protein
VNRILVTTRNDRFPALSHSYDATTERWTHPPSGSTPDAGGAAELRHVANDQEQLNSHNLFSDFSPLERPPVDPLPAAGGHLRAALAECLTTAFGLLVFGLIAWVMLVLA